MSDGGGVFLAGNGLVDGRAGGGPVQANLLIQFNYPRHHYAAPDGRQVIAVCNTGRAGRDISGDPDWPDIAQVREADEIWCVRNPAHVLSLKPRITAIDPELGDLCDDYTPAFEVIAARLGKPLRVLPAEAHIAAETELGAHDPGTYVVPSSGLLALFDILTARHDGPITLAGFGHEGWDGHPFAAEKRLTDQLQAEGRVKRL